MSVIMRTYDKLIATIRVGQGSRGLHSCFGPFAALCDTILQGQR